MTCILAGPYSTIIKTTLIESQIQQGIRNNALIIIHNKVTYVNAFFIFLEFLLIFISVDRILDLVMNQRGNLRCSHIFIFIIIHWL